MTAKENAELDVQSRLPAQPIWGYAGATRGRRPPRARPSSGTMATPMICRIHNELPENHAGFGTPEISTHLHNVHTPSESDGFPGDFYSATEAGPTLAAPGNFQGPLLSQRLRGLDAFGGHRRSARSPGHAVVPRPHRWTSPRRTSFAAWSGFYLIFDDLDTGNEHDRAAAAEPSLRLPAYPPGQALRRRRYAVLRPVQSRRHSGRQSDGERQDRAGAESGPPQVSLALAQRRALALLRALSAEQEQQRGLHLHLHRQRRQPAARPR